MVQQLFEITPPHSGNDFNNFKLKKLSQKIMEQQSKPFFQNQLALPIPDFDPLSEMEETIANDVFKPLVFLLNYTVPFPNRIVYNTITRRFEFIRRSWKQKVVSIVWTALIMWRLYKKICPDSPDLSDGILSYIVRISYVFFIVFCGIFFIQLWTGGQTFTSIFNQGIDASSDLLLKFHGAPRTRWIWITCLSSWIFCLTFSFTSHVIGGIIVIVNEVTGNKNNPSGVLFGYENNTESDYSLNELNPQFPVIYQVILILSNLLNTKNWMLSFLFIGNWALVFRQLFSIFFSKIDHMNQHGYELDLSKEIRTFNKIAALVDKYNRYNGLFVLWGAIVAILYISTSIEQAITGVNNITQFSMKIYLFLSYIPIIITALMISELHRKASTFTDVIKEYYQQHEQCHQMTCSSTSEALYGIVIVYHDMVMSNIGFKGLAFFTVTYQFVVTMLSVIITYALVAIQFLPQLNPAKRQ